MKMGVAQAIGALTLGLAILLSTEAPASAQSKCVAHPEVTKQLGSRYSEAPVAMGLANTGGVVEIFAKDDGSSWTMVVTMPNGMSCMMAAGEAWESLPKIARGPRA